MTAVPKKVRIAYHAWQSAARDARYWERLASKYEAIDGRLGVTTGILSSAAFLSLVIGTSSQMHWPSYVQGIITGGCAIVSAGLSFYSRHKAYAKQSSKCAMLHGMCTQLEHSWKRVVDGNRNNPAASDDLIFELQLRSEHVLAFEAGHRQDDRIALICENEVREMEKLYRTQFKSRRHKIAEGAP